MACALCYLLWFMVLEILLQDFRNGLPFELLYACVVYLLLITENDRTAQEKFRMWTVVLDKMKVMISRVGGGNAVIEGV